MAWEGIEHPITATTVRFAPGQRAKYVPNHRSMRGFLRSEQMRDVTAEVARAIAAVATATQPEPSEDPEKQGLTYTVKREGGFVKIGGNIRVAVVIDGTGDGVERAEFGTRGEKRFRNLARAGAKFGDLHHSEDVTKAR
jgi:hypothetical protein